MAKRTTDADRELLGELGLDIVPAEPKKLSAKDQRIIAGFEEIERFVFEHGRAPEHGENCDIFERLYAVRLDQLRASDECREILSGLDSRGLLDAIDNASLRAADTLNDEALLASLGLDPDADETGTDSSDVTQLVHVRSRSEINAAADVAQRTPCEDFDKFQPIFDSVQHELETGDRQTIKYKDNADVNKGDLFILDGHKVIVADIGDPFVGEHGRPDRRLRVVYDNATESDLLLRSLQRALNKDKASRRISTSNLGPLFSSYQGLHSKASDAEEENKLPTGYIYVLSSQSEHPFIAKNRSVVHKIGVTGGSVESRIANAKKDSTYLLADVEIVRKFKLVNINRKKLEALIQRFFSSAQLELALTDRFGNLVKPKEWFLVPVTAIEEAVDKIRDGTIDQFRYDRETASLVIAFTRAKAPNG